jgi:hypothetical protein
MGNMGLILSPNICGQESMFLAPLCNKLLDVEMSLTYIKV